ncbi:DUF559 domain-containing protein [Corynebacterium qintianiae]|uniref:DUF559 domain-containing protein n=1 Tax=Corynebacterium qintianiae TaxID=2709392 RepID=A0A7T0PF96_9CORY|nr:DUF559 domain-containing protein [Corynebacterium qintianiae]QPK83625.1 DUF559 domain-containing protein [Corynebacterium qintianiae]
MGVDREDPFVEAQRAHFRASLQRDTVNLRTSAGLAAVASARMISLGDQLAYPRAKWEKLAHHKQQLLKVMAAGWSCRGGILTGRSAARVCGMWVVALPEEKLEVSLPSRASSPSRVATRDYQFRYSRIPAQHISLVDGILVTVLVRTFADIARFHGFLEGLIAVDWLRFRGIDLEVIRDGVCMMGRSKGIATVRGCIEHSVGSSDSPFESLARGMLIEGGVTGVKAQVSIGNYLVDLLVEGWLIIEIDGAVKYNGPDAERARQREFTRQKAIANRGYVFLRYTPGDLLRDPEGFVSEVRWTLAHRRPTVPPRPGPRHT